MPSLCVASHFDPMFDFPAENNRFRSILVRQQSIYAFEGFFDHQLNRFDDFRGFSFPFLCEGGFVVAVAHSLGSKSTIFVIQFGQRTASIWALCKCLTFIWPLLWNNTIFCRRTRVQKTSSFSFLLTWLLLLLLLPLPSSVYSLSKRFCSWNYPTF